MLSGSDWRKTAALGAALAAMATVGHAQISPSSNGPIDITADNGTFTNATCESTWSGAAEVLQGNSRLRAQTIHAFLKKKAGAGGSAPATGATATQGGSAEEQSNCGATDRIEADGDVFYVTPDETARGDHAVYTADNDQIVMTGDVIVVQGKNVVHGDRMTIHVKTRAVEIESSAKGRGAPGRVRGVFYSDQAGTPGLPALGH